MDLPAYFTEYEQNILKDRDFFTARYHILEKMHGLLDNFRLQISQKIDENPPDPILPCNTDSGKISKGENFDLMPWMALDFPRHFSRQRVFAFRTLFWWGHFFAFNLHIEGDLIEKYRKPLIDNLASLTGKNFFISHSTTPWNYRLPVIHNPSVPEYSNQNSPQLISPGSGESKEVREFIPLTHQNSDLALQVIRSHHFIKISKPLDLSVPFHVFIQEGLKTYSALIKAAGHN